MSDQNERGSEEEEFFRLTEDGILEKCDLELPRGYLSSSQVNRYLKCGMQYKFRYIDGIIRPPGIAMAAGSSVHRALEIALKEKMKTSSVPLSLIEDAWWESWRVIKKDIEDWEEDENTVEGQLRKLVKVYHSTKLPEILPLEVEKRFWISVGKSNVPVVGYIDLIDQPENKTIVDHKVVGRSKQQREADSSLQLTLYSKAMQIPKVRFDCLVRGTKTPTVKTLSSQRTQADLDWLEHLFDKVAEAINKGIFMPCDPSSFACSPKYCGYYELCKGR